MGGSGGIAHNSPVEVYYLAQILLPGVEVRRFTPTSTAHEPVFLRETPCRDQEMSPHFNQVPRSPVLPGPTLQADPRKLDEQ
ncbi:MAG TPA: hypothetical protein VMX16_08505 [Terriglobia bacterium]|nr:hypothetical protein [Terriglobia bacterium]